MTVFVINLERAPERMKFMSEELAREGLDFSRVPAIDGCQIPPDQIEKETSAFCQWCVIGRRMTNGEVGCALSHINIWQKMVSENIPLACVLEDDVTILPGFKERLFELETDCNPLDCSVYHLSTPRELDQTPRIVPMEKGDCACGYVLTKGAAKRLLACNNPIIYPIDTWGVWIKAGVSVYKVVPKTVGHYNSTRFGTTTGIFDGRAPQGKISRLIKRAIGKIFEVPIKMAICRKAKRCCR